MKPINRRQPKGLKCSCCSHQARLVLAPSFSSDLKTNAWSEEAREASIETRRAKAKGEKNKARFRGRQTKIKETKSISSFIKTIPSEHLSNIKFEIKKETGRGEAFSVPGSRHIILSEELLNSHIFASSEEAGVFYNKNKEKNPNIIVRSGFSLAMKFDLPKQGDIGKIYAENVIAHEIGHVVRDSLSFNLQTKASQLFSKVKTPTIAAYAAYVDSRKKEYEEKGLNPEANILIRKVAVEQFSEAYRLWVLRGLFKKEFASLGISRKGFKHNSFLHINKRKTIRSFDPTQTRLFRDRYVAQMRKRFKLIRKAIFEFVVKEDCFGLVDSPKVLEWTDEAREASIEARKAKAKGEENKQEFRERQKEDTEKEINYKTTMGLDDAVNKDLISAAKIKIISEDPDLSKSINQAIAHVIENRQLAEHAKGISVVIKDLGRIYGTMRGTVMYVDKATLKQEGPGFLAAIFRHELEHKILTKKGVPSAQQESRVRFTTGFFAQMKYSQMAKSNPHAAKGFLKAAKLSGMKINRRDFAFRTSSDKVTGFMDWLMKQEDDKILEITYSPGKSTVSRRPWEKMYIQSAYKKGMERSEKELRKMGVKITPFSNTPIFSVDAMFNLPVHADRIGLLYTRSFNELKGITDVMDQKISRSLAQGMAEGRGPREIARDLIKEVDISQRRAETLARTEIINAHAEATLNTYAAAGIYKVAVEAEWSTAQDDKVCPLCEPMDGKIFDLKEARGMIPRHPNCRCAWLPVVDFDK